MTTGGEARAHPRARAQIKVVYHHGSTTAVGHSTDISAGGLFLVGHQLARPGTRIYLRLHLPSALASEPLKIIGVVTRAVRPANDDPSDETGMGVHFEVAYARTRGALSSFVESLLLLDNPEARRPSIHLLPGATEEQPAYAIHFAGAQAAGSDANGELTPTPTAEQLHTTFAFEAEPTSIDWARFGSLALKIAVLLLLVGIAGMVLRCGGIASIGDIIAPAP